MYLITTHHTPACTQPLPNYYQNPGNTGCLSLTLPWPPQSIERSYNYTSLGSVAETAASICSGTPSTTNATLARGYSSVSSWAQWMVTTSLSFRFSAGTGSLRTSVLKNPVSSTMSPTPWPPTQTHQDTPLCSTLYCLVSCLCGQPPSWQRNVMFLGHRCEIWPISLQWKHSRSLSCLGVFDVVARLMWWLSPGQQLSCHL